MSNYTLDKNNVVFAEKYMGDGKYAKTYSRYRIIKTWKKSTLLTKVNIATRNGWIVTHWTTHAGFFPSALLVKTYLCDTDEAV